MSAIEKRVVELAKIAIDRIIAAAKKTDAPHEALAAIGKIGESVRAAFARQITPAELAAVIAREEKSLADQLAGNKKKILAEIAEHKFPTP